MDRRQFTQSLLLTVASHSLLQLLFTRDAFATPIRPITNSWVRDLNAMSADLKTGKIRPSDWQAKIQELYDRVELPDLLARIDFAKLSAGFDYPDLGIHTRSVEFPQLDGLPKDLVFVRKIFGMKKDRAILPHGHKNMVSCHYVLKGDFRLRHYDKVEEDETHMLIEPTIDHLVGPGTHSSISDEKNNIHWLQAKTETAFTFDVIVLDLQGKPADVENIDPDRAERLGGGKLRVRKLEVAEALRKYGHDMHH
jgi:hypothetical protein